MKTFLSFLFSFIALTISAQSPAVKKSSRAVFSLNTFRSDGSLIGTSHGIFISGDGYAVSRWKPFVGASKAVVVDAQGRKYDVDALVSANDIYDVCKFHVSGSTPSAPVANATMPEKSTLWLSCYSVKAPRLLRSTVNKIETFSVTGTNESSKSYPFYILNLQTPEDVDCCPLLDDAGNAIALLQPVAGKTGTSNAVSVKFVADMQSMIIGQGANTLALSAIPPLMPSDYKDAQVALVLAGQQRDPEYYACVVESFIRSFPQKADGYVTRARLRLSSKDVAGADADMQRAIDVSDDKSETHLAFSNLILQKELYLKDVPYESWGYDKALSEAQEAYRLNPMPVFKQQEARILFAKGDYKAAKEIYLSLQSTSLGGPETMFAATQCSQALGEPLADVMALMDSTIAVCPHPLTFQSAPYIFQRGLIYQQNGENRKAVSSYNDYERLMVGNYIAPDFYYNRFVCERDSRLYQQALDDINKAISLNPSEPLYLCELGSLQLRLKYFDEAISSANKALIINRSLPDAYAILGAAQCYKGQKHEGMLNLEQAKSLGYEMADELIKKFGR
ncbi:MAG: hypothetical protein ACI3Y5_00150 [Prevotella sp.]